MPGNEILQHIIAQLKDMLCIIDYDGTIRQINPNGCGLLRYPPDKIIGEPWTIMFEDNSKPLAPEIITQTIDGAKWSGEILFKRSDKVIFPVYMITSLIPSLIEGENCIALVATDITHKKQLEEAIRKRVELSNKIIDNAPIGILSLNPKGLIHTMNKAFCSMTGIKNKLDNTGKAFGDLPADFNPTLGELVGRALKGETIRELGYILMSNESSKLIVSLTILPLQGPRERIDGAVALFEDRTDKARMEEKLLQADKLASMGFLAAGVAHEISNPLTGMYTIIEGFRDDARERGEEDEPYERILSSIDRIKGIIGKLLTFANPSSQAPRLAQLNDLLINSVEFFKQQPVYRRIRIVTDLDSDLPDTVLDANQITQVLHNMFINSAQAMPNGGEVRLTTRHENGGITLEFGDTGSGIAPENLAKIFDPFFTTKPTGVGTGLGLSVSYGIIQDHGGHIEVESELGKGTRFTITLPVKKDVVIWDEG